MPKVDDAGTNPSTFGLKLTVLVLNWQLLQDLSLAGQSMVTLAIEFVKESLYTTLWLQVRFTDPSGFWSHFKVYGIDSEFMLYLRVSGLLQGLLFRVSGLLRGFWFTSGFMVYFRVFGLLQGLWFTSGFLV